MEIHKENHLLEQFEKTKSFKRFFSTLLRFDEDLDCFVATEKWRDKEAELLTAAWWMFVEVAKHQPVPEGFEQAYSEIFSPIIKQPYPRLENGDYKYIEIDQGWKLWQTAAAQAVPEGFVLAPKKPDVDKAWDIALKRIVPPPKTKDAIQQELMCKKYVDDLCSEQDRILLDYKAMIEAQEQSHE